MKEITLHFSIASKAINITINNSKNFLIPFCKVKFEPTSLILK